LAFNIENHIKYNGHAISSSFGNIESTTLSIVTFSLSCTQLVDKKLDAFSFFGNNCITFPLPTTSVPCSSFCHLSSKYSTKLSFNDFPINSLFDTICDGIDPAATKVIVEISTTTDVKNRLV